MPNQSSTIFMGAGQRTYLRPTGNHEFQRRVVGEKLATLTSTSPARFPAAKTPPSVMCFCPLGYTTHNAPLGFSERESSWSFSSASVRSAPRKIRSGSAELALVSSLAQCPQPMLVALPTSDETIRRRVPSHILFPIELVKEVRHKRRPDGLVEGKGGCRRICQSQQVLVESTHFAIGEGA